MENIRPTFLTVLCVLTFIGSGWGIFNGISSYTNADVAAGLIGEQFERAQDELENQEGAEGIGKIFDSVNEAMEPEKIRSSGIASIVSNILTLVGALLMWGLRKTGFYVYVIGAIAAIIAPIMIYQGFVGAAAAGATAFFGIIFIVLYFLNLKHLR
jgi:hypothetical protein